jgi:alkyl hydroperoxide reductase subunit AhpC
MDKNLHDWSDMRAELSLAYPVLDDASLTVSRLYDVESLPIVLLIDREGVVREVIRGYGRGSDQKYSEGVEALLKD